MILPCTCTHPAQDALHGKGNRVYNACGVAANKARCTVCGKEVAVARTEKAEK